MDSLIFCVHGSEKYSGGQYNILSSFCVGLCNALSKKGYLAGTANQLLDKNIIPNVYISFNVTGYPMWETTLNSGLPQIMWNVDSVFHQNYNLIKEKSEKYSNFLLFNVTKSDETPAKLYLPRLQQAYLPHAVDPEIWQADQPNKECDIILTSHLCDYQSNIEEIKQKYNSKYYETFMDLYEFLMNNSENSFWEVYQYYTSQTGLDINDAELYHYLFMDLCYVVTNAKRIKLVNSLKDFNVKVWGPEIWTKYIEDGVQYMGSSDIFDTIKNTQKAKIALHLQPLQVFHGLHERVLNASMAGAMVLTDEAPFLKSGFKDNFVYYNNVSFENIAENVEYYLKNDDARNEKVENSRKIILENHTWDHRAQMIINLMSELMGVDISQ